MGSQWKSHKLVAVIFSELKKINIRIRLLIAKNQAFWRLIIHAIMCEKELRVLEPAIEFDEKLQHVKMDYAQDWDI